MKTKARKELPYIPYLPRKKNIILQIKIGLALEVTLEDILSLAPAQRDQNVERVGCDAPPERIDNRYLKCKADF